MDYPSIIFPHYLCATLASKEQKVKSLLSRLAQGEKLELFVAIAKLMEIANMTERQGFKITQVKLFSGSFLSFAEVFPQPL